MKTLENLKSIFLEIFPAETEVREKRLRISGGKCENCGAVERLELHHVIFRGNRKKDLERVFTTRMLWHNCHQDGLKFEALPKAKGEVEQKLLKHFETLEVIYLMGSSGLEQ